MKHIYETRKVTNNFGLKYYKMGQKVSKNLSKFYFCKTGQKVTNNLSKFYFWVKKLQNGPKKRQKISKKFFFAKGPKSDKQSIEILSLG